MNPPASETPDRTQVLQVDGSLIARTQILSDGSQHS